MFFYHQKPCNTQSGLGTQAAQAPVAIVLRQPQTLRVCMVSVATPSPVHALFGFVWVCLGPPLVHPAYSLWVVVLPISFVMWMALVPLLCCFSGGFFVLLWVGCSPSLLVPSLPHQFSLR